MDRSKVIKNLQLENTETIKQEADKTVQTKLPVTAFGSQASGSPVKTERLSTNQSLPGIEFIISRGKHETAYLNDGSTREEVLSNKKIDPNCKFSVKTPDGSEQRFDRVGLCKVIGQVKWGKSDDNGAMEISVGEKTKLKLDRNWQLLSVKSENATFVSSVEGQNKAILEHKPLIEHNGWKPLYPEKINGGWQTTLEKAGESRSGEAAATSKRAKVGQGPAKSSPVEARKDRFIKKNLPGPPLDILPKR